MSRCIVRDIKYSKSNFNKAFSVKQCKDCKYFQSISCSKNDNDTPFFVNKESPCWYELSDIICAECEYYSIAEGTTWDMDIGGCTYSGGIRATMQSNPCTNISYLINEHEKGAVYNQ